MNIQSLIFIMLLINICTDNFRQNYLMNFTIKWNKQMKMRLKKMIIIGKLFVKDIEIQNILSAIAKTEMGFEPKIDQQIFFINPLTNTAFQMYANRGCFVWSNNANKFRDIYVIRNKWIVDYHRLEIDSYFK